jgi:hypothetical protein
MLPYYVLPPRMANGQTTFQTESWVYMQGQVRLSLCLSNWALCHDVVWGSGCIDQLILDLSTSWRWTMIFTLRQEYPAERVPGSHWIGSWADPRVGLDDEQNAKSLAMLGFQLWPFGRLARSRSLCRLQYPGDARNVHIRTYVSRPIHMYTYARMNAYTYVQMHGQMYQCFIKIRLYTLYESCPVTGYFHILNTGSRQRYRNLLNSFPGNCIFLSPTVWSVGMNSLCHQSCYTLFLTKTTY